MTKSRRPKIKAFSENNRNFSQNSKKFMFSTLKVRDTGYLINMRPQFKARPSKDLRTGAGTGISRELKQYHTHPGPKSHKISHTSLPKIFRRSQKIWFSSTRIKQVDKT